MMNKLSIYFIKTARVYSKLINPINFLVRRFIKQSSKKCFSSKYHICLDIGSGTSPYQSLINKFFLIDDYISMDIAPSESTKLIASADNIPLPNNSADLIVSFDVLQHLKNSEVAFNEMARILRSGGGLIISVPFLYAECDAHDYRRWTVEGILLELELRDFEILSSQMRGGVFFAFSLFFIWFIQHLFPGQRRGWRSSRSLLSFVNGVLLNILLLPFYLLSWICLFLDSCLNLRGFYMGALVYARKK